MPSAYIDERNSVRLFRSGKQVLWLGNVADENRNILFVGQRMVAGLYRIFRDVSKVFIFIFLN
jgi:hypothetical protein